MGYRPAIVFIQAIFIIRASYNNKNSSAAKTIENALLSIKRNQFLLKIFVVHRLLILCAVLLSFVKVIL